MLSFLNQRASKGEIVKMTVSSQVKVCYSSIKSAEATIQMLANKTQNKQTITAYKQAAQILSEVKVDLQEQVMYLLREEPQY